ncbi:MAG: N-6 DNA methylase [Flavobacteriales bacterium]|nr:N-6 DNA methylase [Flavobacteriales bacterium]
MKPADAIEFILRLHHGVLGSKELLEEVKPFVLEEDFNIRRMKSVIKDQPALFLLEADSICSLVPERMADRTGFFREQMAGLRDTLRSMPFSNSVWTEVALVYALAMRDPEQMPLLSDRTSGIWIILDDLSKEAPQLEKHICYQLESSGVFFLNRVQSHLLAMASAKLTPLEYVKALNEAVLSDGVNGQFATPWWMGELMYKLLGDSVQDVFDPAADSNVTSVVLSEREEHVPRVTAVYWSSFGEWFGSIVTRILARDINAVTGSRPGAHDTLPAQFDHCISKPPFGGKERVEIVEGQKLLSVESYEVAINQILKRLSANGRAVVLVQESALFSENRVAFRRRMIEEGGLSCVISLPSIAFHPNARIRSSILVLDRSSKENQAIRFVNATPFVQEVAWGEYTCDSHGILDALQQYDDGSNLAFNVLKETILGSDQSILSLEHHAAQRAIRHSMVAEPNTRFVELGELLSDMPREETVKTDSYFQVGELSSNVLDLKRSARHGRKEPYVGRPGRTLKEPALLLARVGGKLKPTLFDPSDGPIVIGTNVFAFKVDLSQVDPEYLALELSSDRVQKQVDMLSMGVAIASLSKQALLGILVRTPPLEEQRRIFKEWVEGILLAQRQAIELKATERGLSLSEWQLLGAVEHSLRPVATQVETPLLRLRRLLPTIPEDVRTEAGGAVEQAEQALMRMKAMFATIHQVVRSDKASMKLASIDLRRLLRSEIRALGPIVQHLDVYFHCDPELESPDGVIATIDKEQFALVIHNLLTNMAKHSGASDAESVCVRIDVSHRAEGARRWLAIQVENNGEPFPDGFTHEDLVTPGKLGDPAKGSGLGGFLMDRIIANHGGRFSSGNLPFNDASRRTIDPKEKISSAPRDLWDGGTWMSVSFTILLPSDAFEAF